MKENKSYCSLAFTNIYSQISNKYKLCCFSKQHPSFKKYDGKTPFEFFFSGEMEEIRNKMLAGERIEGCEYCYVVEDNGYISNRQRLNFKITDIEPNSIVLSLKFFGSVCNLSCYMCFPEASTTHHKELKSLEHHVFDNISALAKSVDQKNIDNIIENIEHVKEIQIYGGEPFLMKSCWELLDRIPKKYRSNIKILIGTNLSKVSHKQQYIDEYLDTFKEFRLTVSIDHFGEKLAYLRYPIDVDQLEKNIIKYKQIIKDVAATISILNATDIDEITSYYCDKFDFKKQQIFFHSVVSPAPLSPKNLPDDIKNKLLEKYKNYKENTIDNSFFSELLSPRCEKQFYQFQNYIKSLDKHRKTDANKIFGWKIY